MPGVSSEPPSATYCTVPEAARRLGRSEQTIRNMLTDGRLHEGPRCTRGKRDNIRTVLIASLEEHFRTPGFQPGRLPTNSLEERLTARPSQVVNLEFANLRLMAIHEEYQRVLRDLLAADEHRKQVILRLEDVVRAYREIVEQYQLPSMPPSSDQDR